MFCQPPKLNMHRGRIMPTLQVSPARSSRAFSVRVRAETSIAKLVAQKEEELKKITAFNPGKLPPKASVVAALRKEITALRQQLDAGITTALPSSLGSDLPSLGSASTSLPPINRVSSTRAATANRTSTSQGAAKSAAAAGSSGQAPNRGARGALLLVEQQLAVANGDTSSVLLAVEQNLSMENKTTFETRGELSELDGLKEENAALQLELDELLARKKYLEELKEKHLGSSSSSSSKKSVEPASSGSESDVETPPKKKRTVRRKSTKAAGSESESDGEEKPKRTRKKKAVTTEGVAAKEE